MKVSHAGVWREVKVVVEGAKFGRTTTSVGDEEDFQNRYRGCCGDDGVSPV
jgi:hypothetical protein